MRNAKRNYWKPFKLIFGLILFVIGVLAFSAITNDITIGMAIATTLPIIWIKGGKFTHELTENELKALEKEDVLIYIKELQASRYETVVKSVEEKLKEVITKDALKELQDGIQKLNKAKDEDLEARLKEFEQLAERISKNVTDANIKAENETLSAFEISVKNAKTNKDTNLGDELKTHKNGNKFSFTVKATFVGSDVGTITGNINAQLVPGIGQIAAAKLVLSNFFSVSPIQIDGKGVAQYEDWDEATTAEAAAFIAEGGTYPSSTAKFKTYSITIEKIGDSISMTYESLRDFATFTRELTRFITRNIAKVVNQALWSGTGTTPQFGGIYTQLTAFNSAAYTGATTTVPTLLDLIQVLKKQIMNANDDKYDVNFVFISWEEYLELVLEKDSTGRLIYPNGLPNIGVEIIPTSYVTDNTLAIGDKNYVELIGDPNAISIEVGLKTGDWESDKESIKGRVRTCMLIRNADLDGFLKVTDIDAAIVAITT